MHTIAQSFEKCNEIYHSFLQNACRKFTARFACYIVVYRVFLLAYCKIRCAEIGFRAIDQSGLAFYLFNFQNDHRIIGNS